MAGQWVCTMQGASLRHAALEAEKSLPPHRRPRKASEGRRTLPAGGRPAAAHTHSSPSGHTPLASSYLEQYTSGL